MRLVCFLSVLVVSQRKTFYALKDTKTPVVVSFATLLVNLLAGLVLMNYFGYAGVGRRVNCVIYFLMLFCWLRYCRRKPGLS